MKASLVKRSEGGKPQNFPVFVAPIALQPGPFGKLEKTGRPCKGSNIEVSCCCLSPSRWRSPGCCSRSMAPFSGRSSWRCFSHRFIEGCCTSMRGPARPCGRGHRSDHHRDGHPAARDDRDVAGPGSVRPGRENPVRRIQFRQLRAADTRRPAGLGNRADRAVQADELLSPSRKLHVRPDEGRAGSRPAGAQHRDEHVRLRDQPRHHAVSVVLPVA